MRAGFIAVGATPIKCRNFHRSRARSATARTQLATMSIQARAPMTPVQGLPFLGRSTAAQLDVDLMSESVGYSLAQLMELAGQAVAHAVHDLYPLGRIAVVVGPGNNGGDGLVAARHLSMFGRDVSVVIPPRSAGKFAMLETQLVAHEVHICRTVHIPPCDVIVDAVFGFSFTPRGPQGVEGEYKTIIEGICKRDAAVVCVDVPSGWDVDRGDSASMVSVKNPTGIVSLSAPKLCVRKGHEHGDFAHYVGGRFLPDTVCRRLGFEPIKYEGCSIIRRVA